jgi:hypothetical protein
MGLTSSSATLGYKVAAANPNIASSSTFVACNNAIGIDNPPLSFANNAIGSNNSLIIEKLTTYYIRYKSLIDTYSITNLTHNYFNKSASITLLSASQSFSSALQRDLTFGCILHFYSRTSNNMTYTIDPTIFKDNKKYELSFSFSSSACILNQNPRVASVFVNIGSHKTYDNNTNYNTQSNFLGFLEINNHYNSFSTPVDTTGSVSYSTLSASPSNKPIIVNRPVSNTLNVTILKEDGTLFTDNSNIGLMPSYVISLFFKEI